MSTVLKYMSSMERKRRLGLLEKAQHLGADKTERKVKWFYVTGWLAAGILLVSHVGARVGVSTLYATRAGAAALVLFLVSIVGWILKNNDESKAGLSKEEELDRLLLEYQPVDKEAYLRLQQAVKQEKELLEQTLADWIRAERGAINEHLSPHKKWSFVDRVLD